MKKIESWKQEYEKLLFSADTDKVVIFKNQHIPLLYKYRSFDENNYWVNWVNGNVLANAPTSFNDPFDCILTYKNEIFNSIVKSACIKVLRRLFKRQIAQEEEKINQSNDPLKTVCDILELNGYRIDPNEIKTEINDSTKYQNELRERLRIACFSEVNDSILMWSHYANNHSGFCIKYDFSNDQYIENLLFPVIYKKRRIVITPEMFSKREWIVIASLCKAPVWKYEKEWRFLNRRLSNYPLNTQYGVNALSSIKGIYLGSQTSKENTEKMLKLAKLHKISVYKMEMSEFEYKLQSKPIQIVDD